MLKISFSNGSRIINAEDAANLTAYDLTDFFVNDYKNNSEKNVFENKYLLCKRKISISELLRKKQN